MLEMRSATTEEVPWLKELWRLAFGDGPEFLDLFFGQYFSPEETLVLREGEIFSMLVLAPWTLTDEKGRTAPLPYVYALATHPDSRGKGYAKLLLQYADYRAGQLGAGEVSTVPAQESLHRFFASAGYEERFTTWRREVGLSDLPPVSEGKTAPVSAGDYQALRESLLAGTPHVSYPLHWLELQKATSRMSGADLYEITVDGASCCAAVERVGDTALCKELLAPKGLALKAAARLAVVLPASGYQLRSPWGEDGSWQALPLGMAHPLTTPGVAVRTALGAYMGLAFD